jgi:cupin superfamily acireductone dioxygenase involved in methionine salvage
MNVVQPDNRPNAPDPSTLETLPIGFPEVEQYYHKYKDPDLFALRVETIKRIEKETGNPLICYVTQTNFVPSSIPAELISIDRSDLDGFDTLIDSVKNKNDSKNIDVLFVSNGGSPEAAERIVRLLRENFNIVRFILPANAYSAATMMSFACDSILMTDTASLGPIDPQINGIPARTILRGFQDLEKRIKSEGPQTLAAYIHLLNNYSLHLLEICKSAEELSKELAQTWLSNYMLKTESSNPNLQKIVDFFVDYDTHKSHARSIGCEQAIQLGLKVEKLNRGENITNLVKSLNSQYTFFLTNTPFFKVFENVYGVGWGRQAQIIQSQSSPNAIAFNLQ